MATALAKPRADGDTAAPAKKGGKKLLIIAAVVALLAGGGGGAYFTGALDGLLGGDEADSAGVDAEADSEGGHGAEPGAGGDSTAKAGGHIAEAGASQGDSAAAVDAHGGGGGGGDAAEGEFFDLPEFIVNMNTPGERRRFLRLRARLDVADPQARGRIEAMLPRIVDGFQVFLRELRPADIAGSAGTFRLREELLRRVNSEIAPAKADDLLFVELVVQ